MIYTSNNYNLVILLIGTNAVLTWTVVGLVFAEVNTSEDIVTVEETSGASAEPK